MMMIGRWTVVVGMLIGFVLPVVSGYSATLGDRAWYVMPVQVPYFPPPEPEFPEIPQATPAPKELNQQQLERAEAMLPLLEGRQELYAMAEFNYLGPPVVPVLVKALKMESPRVRYNAIETLSLIKDPYAVPYLLKTAENREEMPRIRAHALRVSVRLDPVQVIPTFQRLVKDPADTIRRTVAVETQYIQHIDALRLLVELLEDPERYVASEAVHSFWRLTRYSGKPHDWENSTQEQRRQWAQEWRVWLDEHADQFQEPGTMGRPPASQKSK